MIDVSTLRQLFDALGFRITDVTINPAVVFLVVWVTDATRRLAAWTGFPAWVDLAICWVGPWLTAMGAVTILNGGARSWERLAVDGWLYSAFGALAYGLVMKQLLAKAFGPINGGAPEKIAP